MPSAVLTLDAGEELTMPFIAALRDAWLARTDNCHSDVEVDLARVQAIDTSGVQLLLSLAITTEAWQCQLVLSRPGAEVMAALRDMALTTLLHRVQDATAP